MPFAGICGRICHHPCEDNCNRQEIDEAVSICNLKRFVADYEKELLEKGEIENTPTVGENDTEAAKRGEKVAIIGGGPGSLTCAHDLVKKGFQVTVFEANDKLGGMMRTGIPDYRLPKDYMDYEINLLLNDGIEVKTGWVFGKDFNTSNLKNEGYTSVFLSTGAQKAKQIPLENCHTDGVIYGIPFLRQISEGKTPSIGKHVAVIGGGNVAVDVARTAL